ncbi:MAG: N-(5'-phosphoribosyl)anthranilate isomerase [Vulcanibacillus sp.]
MTQIKICGLRREEDIWYTNELQPEYGGFVFARSKRQVDIYQAKVLIGKLDKRIKKVGVFLNHSEDEIKQIVEFCNLDIIQLHGDEGPDFCTQFTQRVWKAFRIKDETSFKQLDNYNVAGYLLDTFAEGEYGGTGAIFNWDIVSKLVKDRFIILAGGLTPNNVIRAIEIINPQVVDVSSGVEIDGIKSFDRMKEFIGNVRGLN